MRIKAQYKSKAAAFLLLLFMVILFPVIRSEAKDLTMTVGQNTVLTDNNWYNATGYNKTWTSSNPYVARALGAGTTCRVTALTDGTTTVTCYTQAWKTVVTSVLGADGKWTQRKQTTNYTSTSRWYITVKDNKVIKFSGNGGTALETSRKVRVNTSLGELPEAKRKGYTFAGWYTAASGGARVSKTTVCTANAVYYAHWKKVTVAAGAVRDLSGQYYQSLRVRVSAPADAAGYQIQYSTASTMKNAKTCTTSDTSLLIKGLKRGTTYYVRLRGYKLDSAGEKVYGSWSPVKSQRLPKVVINKPSATLLSGQSAELKLQGASGTIRWTSGKTSVAKVSSTGKVTAVGKGEAVITAQCSTGKYTCKVTVETPKLNYTSLILLTGQSRQLKLSGTSGAITWSSSNQKVAAVSADGRVSAVGKGTATIQGKVRGKAFSCKVTVEAAKINYAQLTILTGQTRQLKVSGTTQPVSWATGSQAVVTVSKDGKITAKAKGSTTVTATVSGRKFSCKVTVEDPALSYTSKTIIVQRNTAAYWTISVKGTTLPVTWSSSNTNVVTIDAEGQYRAVGAGTATLTAMVNSKAFRCKITVEDPRLNQDSLQLEIGETYQLSLSGTSRPYTWKSNSSGVEISGDGVVMARESGYYTVYAEIAGGEKVSCSVKVIGAAGTRTNPLPGSVSRTMKIYDGSKWLGDFSVALTSYKTTSGTAEFAFRITCLMRNGTGSIMPVKLINVQKILHYPNGGDCFPTVITSKSNMNVLSPMKVGYSYSCCETLMLNNSYSGPLIYKIATGYDAAKGCNTYTYFIAE